MFGSALIPGLASITPDALFLTRSSTVSRRSRILVVEGDEVLREAIANALGVAIPTVGAASAGEALRLLSESTPGMVLLNLQIPDMPGIELLKKVRQRLEPAKVIVTSDSGDYDLVRRVNEVGVGDFLEKPYRLEDLFHAVENSVRGVPSAIDFRSLSARHSEQSRLRRQLLLSFA